MPLVLALDHGEFNRGGGDGGGGDPVAVAAAAMAAVDYRPVAVAFDGSGSIRWRPRNNQLAQ